MCLLFLLFICDNHPHSFSSVHLRHSLSLLLFSFFSVHQQFRFPVVSLSIFSHLRFLFQLSTAHSTFVFFFPRASYHLLSLSYSIYSTSQLINLTSFLTCVRPIGLVFPPHSLFYLLIPFSYIIVACRSPKYWDRVQRCTSCRISYVH